MSITAAKHLRIGPIPTRGRQLSAMKDCDTVSVASRPGPFGEASEFSAPQPPGASLGGPGQIGNEEATTERFGLAGTRAGPIFFCLKDWLEPDCRWSLRGRDQNWLSNAAPMIGPARPCCSSTAHPSASGGMKV